MKLLKNVVSSGQGDPDQWIQRPGGEISVTFPLTTQSNISTIRVDKIIWQLWTRLRNKAGTFNDFCWLNVWLLTSLIGRKWMNQSAETQRNRTAQMLKPWTAWRELELKCWNYFLLAFSKCTAGLYLRQKKTHRLKLWAFMAPLFKQTLTLSGQSPSEVCELQNKFTPCLHSKLCVCERACNCKLTFTF